MTLQSPPRGRGCLLIAALTLAASLGAGCSQSPSAAAATTQQTGWAEYGNGPASQHFSPLRQITDANVGQLGLAWYHDIPAAMGLAAEPIVVNGVMYVSAPQSRVYAMDAATGALKWKFDPHVQLGLSTQSSYAARVNRGVAVSQGKVLVATGDCRLIAINAATGQQEWSTPICDPQQTGSTGPPLIARGKAYISFNGADDQVRGALVAVDVATGKLAWRFWTVPGNPAKGFENAALKTAAATWQGKDWWRFGGGEPWGSFAYDAADNTVIFGTSNADSGEGTTPRNAGPKGEDLYSSSVVAVNADSGDLVWYYRTALPERTEVLNIVLADLPLNGQSRQVVMTVPKNGTMYVLDAKTGKPISEKSLVTFGPPAGQKPSSTPGQRTDRRTFGFAHWTVHNWWPMSYSPETKLAYVPITDRRPGATPKGELPLVGRLMAWDPVTQTERWSQLMPIAVNSGVLSTAGNLVFAGQGTGEFDAYNATSGDKLWSIQTGSAIDAVPVTYQEGGVQYVAMPVGWGSGSRTFGRGSMMATPKSKRGPSRVLVFKLGGAVPFPTPPDVVPPVPKPPVQTASAATIAEGARLYESHLCGSCHSPGLDGSGAWVKDGAIPDLRYAPAGVLAMWDAIVLKGMDRQAGMLAFGVQQHYPEITPLSPEQAQAIKAYVIDGAWKAYRAQQKPVSSGQ